MNHKIIKLTDHPTGTAVINVNQAGENAITLVKGANDEFTDADLESLSNLVADDYLLVQNEINADINHKAISLADERGAHVVLNPAPSYVVPEDILAQCAFVIVNEHELKEVFRINGFQDIDDIDAELLYLSEKYQTNIILTLGAKGSKAAYEGQILTHQGHKVEVVDTTGAGDCFCGVFVSCLSRDMGLQRALEIANKAASISVTKLGANNSFPQSKDVE